MSQSRDASYREKELALIKELIKSCKASYQVLLGDSQIESQKIQMARERILLFKQQLSGYENKVAQAFHSVQSMQERLAKIGVSAPSDIEMASGSVSNAFQHVDAMRTQIQETENAVNHYETQIQKQMQATEFLKKQYLGAITVISNSLAQLQEEGQPQAIYDQARENVRLQRQAIKEAVDALDFSKDDIMQANQVFLQAVELTKNTLGHAGSEVQTAMAPVDKLKDIKEIFLKIYALNHVENNLNEIQIKANDLNDTLRNGGANVLDTQLMFSGQLTTARSEIEKTLEMVLGQAGNAKKQAEEPKDKNGVQLESEAEVKRQRQRLLSAQEASFIQKSHENQLKNKPILDAFLKLLYDEIARIQNGSAIYKQKKINNLSNLISVVRTLGDKSDLDLKKEFEAWTQDPKSAYSQVIRRSHFIHRFLQMENQSHVAIKQFFNETYSKLMGDQAKEAPVIAEEKATGFAPGGRRTEGG